MVPQSRPNLQQKAVFPATPALNDQLPPVKESLLTTRESP
jgi:hypothetical protein